MKGYQQFGDVNWPKSPFFISTITLPTLVNDSLTCSRDIIIHNTMPDTSSSQAPSVVDLTTANRDIRGRALTLRETPKSEALQIKIWPSLYNPDQQAVRDEFYKLGDASSHIGMVSEAMGKTGIYTADYITGVKET